MDEADTVSSYLADNRDFLRGWLLQHADSDWLRSVTEEAKRGAGCPQVITADITPSIGYSDSALVTEKGHCKLYLMILVKEESFWDQSPVTGCALSLLPVSM